MQPKGIFEIYKLNENNEEILIDKVENKLSIDFLRILIGLYNPKFSKTFPINNYFLNEKDVFTDAYKMQYEDISSVCIPNILDIMNIDLLDLNDSEFDKQYNNLDNPANFILNAVKSIYSRASDSYRACKVTAESGSNKLFYPVYTKFLYFYNTNLINSNNQYYSGWSYLDLEYTNVVHYKLADKYIYKARYLCKNPLNANAIRINYSNIPANLARLSNSLNLKTNDVVIIKYTLFINKSAPAQINYKNKTNINFNLINNSQYRFSLNYSCLYNFMYNLHYYNSDDFSKYTDDSIYNKYFLKIYPFFKKYSNISENEIETKDYENIVDIYKRNFQQLQLLYNNSVGIIDSYSMYDTNTTNTSENFPYNNNISKIKNLIMHTPDINDLEVYYSINNDKKFEFDIHKTHKYKKCNIEDFLYWKNPTKKLPGVVVRDIKINSLDGDINSIKFFVKQQVKLMNFDDSKYLGENPDFSDFPNSELESTLYDVFFEYTFLPVLNFETPYTAFEEETLPLFYHGFATDDTRNI